MLKVNEINFSICINMKVIWLLFRLIGIYISGSMVLKSLSKLLAELIFVNLDKESLSLTRLDETKISGTFWVIEAIS